MDYTKIKKVIVHDETGLLTSKQQRELERGIRQGLTRFPLGQSKTKVKNTPKN